MTLTLTLTLTLAQMSPTPTPNPNNPYPDQVTIDLFKEAISSTPGPYLIEGFPRTLESLTT